MALSSKQLRTVQDESEGESIIDCCAAPGGKTLFMASRLRGQVSPIHDNLRIYAGKNNVKFHKVLLDAPCSGLGVLFKRADLRWNRRLEDLEHLTRLQDELLDAASMSVRPGGVLVYSTCSIDPSENEERVAAFLLRHPAVASPNSNATKRNTVMTSSTDINHTITPPKKKKLKRLQDLCSDGYDSGSNMQCLFSNKVSHAHSIIGSSTNMDIVDNANDIGCGKNVSGIGMYSSNQVVTGVSQLPLDK